MGQESRQPAAGRGPCSFDELRPRKHSPAGLKRLREAALRNRPWEYANGPVTPEGKARAAQNGRYAQKGPLSQREIAALRAECGTVSDSLAELRQRIRELS